MARVGSDVVMGRAITLREDFDGPGPRRLAKCSKDGARSRRLLALAEIYDGGRRMDAARIGAVGLQVIRDWVLRFNAEGPDGLIDRKAPGQRAKLNDEQRRALARIVEADSIPAVRGVVRWRRKDLALWIFEEFVISLEVTSVGREPRAMGFCKMTARPRHKGQNEYVLDDFKEVSQPRWSRSGQRSRPARTWRSGGGTKPGSGGKPSSRGAGPGAAPDLRRRKTNALSRPASSARSVRPGASVRDCK